MGSVGRWETKHFIGMASGQNNNFHIVLFIIHHMFLIFRILKFCLLYISYLRDSVKHPLSSGGHKMKITFSMKCFIEYLTVYITH